MARLHISQGVEIDLSFLLFSELWSRHITAMRNLSARLFSSKLIFYSSLNVQNANGSKMNVSCVLPRKVVLVSILISPKDDDVESVVNELDISSSPCSII